MLGEPPTEEEFTLIRAEGENGAILKVALAFGFNLPPDIGALLSSMGRGMSIWEQQSGCFQTLVSIWRYVLGSVSMTGSPHNEELVQELESLLSQRTRKDPCRNRAITARETSSRRPVNAFDGRFCSETGCP